MAEPRKNSKGYTPFFHDIIGDVFPKLSLPARAVYMYIWRYTAGYHCQTFPTSVKDISIEYGMSQSAVKRSLAELAGQSLIDYEPVWRKRKQLGLRITLRDDRYRYDRTIRVTHRNRMMRWMLAQNDVARDATPPD